MSALLLALFLLLMPSPAGAETLRAVVTMDADAAALLPPPEGIRAGLSRLFTAEYGRFIELSLDDRPAGGGIARTTLGLSGDMVSVTTDLTRGAATWTVTSTVPRGSPSSLVATMAGDIAFLHFSSRGFTDLQLSPAPRLTAMIHAGALQAVTGWNAGDLEPLSVTQSGDDVVICFPHGYLTLGPRFALTADTLADVHAQATGREPLQLSGIAPLGGSGAEGLLLLSERARKIVKVDPRRGTRQALEAPGLAMSGGQRIDINGRAVGLAVLSPDRRGISVYPLSGGPPRSLPVPGSYVSAFCGDREGNLWLWDTGDRRVRILTPDGVEVHSIKPLFAAATMPMPQQMGVCDDGSFLLAGYGEVWMFESTGIPVWRLTRVPGRPGERLPPSFGLAVNGADGSFTILDAQSRRLLAFSPAPADDAAALAAVLAGLDGRRPADMEKASTLALAQGLPLVAWQYGDLLAGSGGDETRRAEARTALLREKARRYVELADSLGRDLLLARADAAYLGAGESLRSLLTEMPGDPDATRLLQTVIGRRQEVRAALSRGSDVLVEQADARGSWSPQAGQPVLVMRLRLRNTASQALSQVRVHLNIPGVTPMPSLADVGELAPDEGRDVEVFCAGAAAALEDGAMAYARVTYNRGGESVLAAFSFPVSVAVEGDAPDPAAELARRVLPEDALVKRVASELLPSAPGNGITVAAVLLDALGAVRAGADSARTVGAARTEGADHGAAAGAASALRPALRELSPNETAWTLVTVSLAASLGVQPGLLACRERLYALVDAGVPLTEALASHPAMARFTRLLSLVSRNGNLWLPLSAAVALPGAARATAWAAADALKALAAEDDKDMRILWPLPPLAATAAVPVPFPLALPVTAAPVPGDALLGQVEAAIERQ